MRWSDCAGMQTDTRFCCPLMSLSRFSHGMDNINEIFALLEKSDPHWSKLDF